MERFLAGYEVSHPTWFYLSFLLIVTVFFRFHRVWSLRNLDLALLLAITPGILLFEFAAEDPRNETYFVLAGYSVLLPVTGLLLLRLFCDGLFQRRPRLEQNLNNAGVIFIGIASFAFLVTSALRNTVPESSRRTAEQAGDIVHGGDEGSEAPRSDPDTSVGLTTQWLIIPATIFDVDASMTARIAAILSHVAVVLGLCYIGWITFQDFGVGLAMALLYILLPPTSVFVGHVSHVLPAALIVWAFAMVQRPIVAGVLLGLACGTQVFVLFLLPLWWTWYGREGIVRFLSAWGLALAVAAGLVAITATSSAEMANRLARTVDWAWLFTPGSTDGREWEIKFAVYRIPAFVGFLVMLAILTFWPLTKNLDQLLARSAAVVVGAQFWYPQNGGLYVLWYLPLVLLVVFRPNLDRVSFRQPGDERIRRADDPDDTAPAPVGSSGRYVFR